MTMLMATYPSSHAALKAEKRLHAAGLTVELIPTPRQFSSDCGVALRFETVHREGVAAKLAEARLDVELRELSEKER